MNKEPKYTPLFFPPGGHLQTLVRSYLAVRPRGNVLKKRFELQDGDFMDLELSGSTPDALRLKPDSPAPVVLLLHGLEGSSARPYMRAMTNDLVQKGFQVICLNFRGCSGELNRKRITYHAGKYDDLEQIVEWVRQTYHPSSLHLVGFSLGASVMLNFLIHSAHKQHISSAVAISPPLELGTISDDLQLGLRTLYQTYFLRSLREKNRLKIEQFRDYPSFTGQTLREFDDQVTAPVHGFSSAEHYYQTCSVGSRLNQITIPVRIIHAVNDPICTLPSSYIASTKNEQIEWSVQRGGGHVAFLTLPRGWLGHEVASFLRK